LNTASPGLGLTIVIPSFRSAHLAAVIEPLRALSAAEIIVVDSSPEAPVLPEGCRLIHSAERRSAARARNIGARAAGGAFILFVDSDVVLRPEAIEQVKWFLAAPQGDLHCGIYDTAHAGDSFASRLQNHILAYRLFHRWQGRPPVGSSSHFLVRRAAFERIGGFNEAIASYEDIEFIVRAVKTGHTLTTSDRFVGIHLKQFDLMSLLRDYGRKTYQAYEIRQRYAGLFQGCDANLGLAMMGSWLAAGLLLPLLLVVSLAFPAALVAAAICVLSPMAVWRPVLAAEPLGFRLRALACWPLIGATVFGAAGLAALHWRAGQMARLLTGWWDYARILVRVLLRTGRPIQLIQYVTARCNLRCEHCFYKESLEAPNPGELPAAVLESVMKDTGPVLWFSLAGGEPFLRKDLVELMLAVQRHNRPKVFSFPTNGWYTERTFEMVLHYLQRAPGGNLMLFFSLDGPQEVHDAIRGPNSYAHVRETMDRLRPLQSLFPQLHLNVVTTVQPGNMAHFPGFIDQVAAEFRPNAISINLFRHHSLEHPPLPPGLIDAYSAAVDAYRGLLARGGLAHYSFTGGRILRLKEILQKELIERVARGNEFVTPCTAGTLSYVVMEDARLRPCEILSDSLGKVDQRPLAELIATPEAGELRRWIRDTKCRCTYECAMSSNVLFSWPMTWRLIGAYIRDLAGIR